MDTLTVDTLTVRFGGLVALDGVSLHVASGEVHGLIGPNGAGKTTLLNAVTGLIRVAGGSIRFLGQETTNWVPHRVVRSGIARTFQNLLLFPGLTVLEQIAVARREALRPSFIAAGIGLPAARRQDRLAMTDAGEMLEQLGLTPYAQAYPGDLPIGIARRVDLARALVSRPRLLLVDEVASGLNPAETAEIAQVLTELKHAQNLSILLIDHDMSLIFHLCDRLTVLDSGRFLTAGTPEAVAADPRVIEVYLGGDTAAGA